MTTSILKNGLRVMLAPSDGSQTVTALVLVRVGSRYEDRELNGASHFIEHLLFKGTKKRPTAQHISRALDALGAEFNAFTDKHVTGYYIKVDRSALGLALDILSDMLFASRFASAEVNRERTVVIEEINMYRDTPMRHVEDLLEEAMFAGHTLGWNIAGTPKTMKAMPRARLLNYHQEFYQPSNMVLAVAGHVDTKALSVVEAHFGKRRDHTEAPSSFISFMKKARREQAPFVRLQEKNTAQIQIAIGFPSFGIDDNRNLALGLLSVVLGGNMSSRLFVQVRERRGLAYFVRASNTAYDDVGVFSIRAGLDKRRLPLAMKTILSELRKVARSGVTTQELRDAKTFFHGQMSIQMEDTFHQAEWYAKQKLFKKEVLSPEAYRKRLDALTLADVKHVAKEVIVLSCMSIAAVGPYRDRADFLIKSQLPSFPTS